MSAETARLSATPAPLGKPGGPGLFKEKGNKLPNYIEQVAQGLMKGGKSRSQAIQMAIGVVKNWASGKGNVSPEVRAAAGAAVAEWEALKAKAKATPNKGSADMSNPGGGVELASAQDVTGGLGMVALEVPAGTVPSIPGGTAQDDMHVTLCFLGKDVTDAQLARALMGAYDVATRPPLSGTVGGLGVFPPDEDGKVPVWCPVDVPGLSDMALRLSRLSPDAGHAFTPHITLGFVGSTEKLPAPVEQRAVTFSQLIVKRGDQVFRFPLGGGDDGPSAMGYAAVRAAALELARPADTPGSKQVAETKPDSTPAKGDKKSAAFGEPDLPPGATHWKHGWVPVNDSGKAVGPAQKPKWLQGDEKKQLAAGGKTAEGYRQADAARVQKQNAKNAAAPGKRAAAAAKAKLKKAAGLLKSKKSKEAAAAKKQASDRSKLITAAYRQAVADQKAGRKLTPQQSRVLGAVQATQAKRAASLRGVDVPGAPAGKSPVKAPKAATKPLTASQKAAQARAAERAKIAAARKSKAGSKYKITKLANEGGRVNDPFVVDLAGHSMPAGHLIFRYKHGWILINPAVPSRGHLGGGLAAKHGHKSGTVTEGHFETHPSGKGKIFVADHTGAMQPSHKAAILNAKKHDVAAGKINYKKAPADQSKFTTAAQGTPKPADTPKTPEPDTAALKKKAVAASQAAVEAGKAAHTNDTSKAHSDASLAHANAYVANQKAGKADTAANHKAMAQAHAKTAAAKKAAAKSGTDQAAKAKATAEAAHKAEQAKKDADYAKAKAQAQELSTKAFANPTEHAHNLAADAHEHAAILANQAGNDTAYEAHTGVADLHSEHAQKIYDAAQAAKQAKEDALYKASEVADQMTQTLEEHPALATAKAHQATAAAHQKAADLAKEHGNSLLHASHQAAAEDHLSQAAPAPVADEPTGGLSMLDAVDSVINHHVGEAGTSAAWDDYLQAAQQLKENPGNKTYASQMLAAKKALNSDGVTTEELQAANAQVAKMMHPVAAPPAKKAVKKAVGKKTAAKKATPTAPAAPSTAKDWEVELTGPGMYKDGNKIKDLMGKPATNPEADQLKRDAVDKALADFKAKHGHPFDINSVESFGDLTGGSGSSHLADDYFEDAKAAGFIHPATDEDVTHGWKPPADTTYALKGYTGEGHGSYVAINGGLRGGDLDSDTRSRVESMDEAFAAAPGLANDTVTVRKMASNGQFPAIPPPMSEGDEYVDYGYGSTSKSLSGWSGGVIMQVRMPKGMPVIDVNHNHVVSASTSEQEVLMPRGARYRVVSDEMVDGQRQIITEVVGWNESHPNVEV
jgi:2'-5' RNA ligase